MKIAIRHANDSDINWIVGQLMELYKFQGTKFSLFSTPEFAIAGIKNLIDNQFVIVAHGLIDGTIERMGFIFGILIPHPLNPTIRTFIEQFWWVEPKHRNTRAGLMLLNEFMEFGEKNADWILFGLQDTTPTSDRMLTRRGFRVKEIGYLKEVG
jgi:hypothetical protein